MDNTSMKWYSGPFVNRLKTDIIKICTDRGFIKGELYEVEDLNNCWKRYAPEYMADAVPEIAHYPTVAIAWAAFFGMATAELWDEKWEETKDISNLYETIRDPRGFDAMDDYILEDILKLLPQNPTRASELVKIIQDCAEIALGLIRKEGIEPQSREAFYMFAKTTEIMFKLGVTIELYFLGYKYEKFDINNN